MFVGHGRCGSTYISRVMTQLGHPTAHEHEFHENPDVHNISDWMLGSEVQRKKIRKIDSWDHVLIFARHPVSALPAIREFENQAASRTRAVANYVPELLSQDLSTWEAAAVRFSGWYEHLLETFDGPIIRVEYGAVELFKWLRSNNFVCIRPSELPPKTTHSEYRGKRPSWSDLKPKLSSDTIQRLCQITSRLGYSDIRHPPNLQKATDQEKLFFRLGEQRG